MRNDRGNLGIRARLAQPGTSQAATAVCSRGAYRLLRLVVRELLPVVPVTGGIDYESNTATMSVATAFTHATTA